MNLDFNQGQGRFELIQWCILVVKRITQSKQRIKQSRGSSIFSSSHSSKIEEVMEITFTTIFFLITSFKIEEVSKAKLTNQNRHGSHNIQYPRIKSQREPSKETTPAKSKWKIPWKKIR